MYQDDWRSEFALLELFFDFFHAQRVMYYKPGEQKSEHFKKLSY